MKRKSPRVPSDGRPLPSDLLDQMSRRTFVKTSSGLLVAAGLGCNPDLNPTIAGVFPTGQLSLTINGLPSGLPDAGAATLTRTDVTGKPPIIVNLPASGSVQTQLFTGSFHVVYTPPSGYQVVGANVFDVVIAANATSSLSVSVIVLVAQGTLRIVVTGLTAAPVDGGTASILRTDVSGQSPIAVPVPKASGQVDTAVAAGAYTVTYTPPIGFTIDPGTSNPQNIAVASGAIAQASYGLSAPAGFATPDILNNASFETGWDGFTDGGSGVPVNMTRATDQAYRGTTSAKYSWVPNLLDAGAAAYYNFNAIPRDEVWTRLYFRLAAGWSLPFVQKFHLFYSASASVDGGWHLNDGSGLWWTVYAESSSVASVIVPRASITSDTWHSIETHYRRNGETLPNAAFWYDGVQVTKPDGPDPAGGGMTWLSGRLYSGPTRRNSYKLGLFKLGGTLNPQSGSGTMWFDRVAASSLGRIGP